MSISITQNLQCKIRISLGYTKVENLEDFQNLENGHCSPIQTIYLSFLIQAKIQLIFHQDLHIIYT